MLDNPRFRNKFFQINIDILLHLTGQHQIVGMVSPLSLRKYWINVHEIAVVVVAIHSNESVLLTSDETAAVVVVHPFLGLFAKIFVDFDVYLWQFGVVSELVEQIDVGNPKAAASPLPIAVRNTHDLGPQLKPQLLHVVVDLPIAEHIDLVGDDRIGVFSSASKEQEIGNTPQGLDTICGEKDMRAVVKIDLVVLFLPEEGGDKVEDVLGAVDVHEEGRDAMEGAVGDQLHPDLHLLL